MKTYLVTGGAGFIGSNYIHYMFRKYGDSIRILNVDALTYAGNLENLKGVEERENYTFIRADICDKEAITKIFAENDIDRVVHFAAESHVDRSIVDPEIFLATNVLGTQALLDAAKEHWKVAPQDKRSREYKEGVRFLQVSTDEVYGALGKTGQFAETTPLAPNSPYAASKAGADLIVRAYYETYGLPANITRCSNNYGPYQFPEKLIPLMLNNCLEDRPLPVYGDGLQVRDWLYVEDHCSAICAVLEKGGVGEIYNVGGNNERANLEIVKLITKELGKGENLITHVSDRMGHDRRYAIDNTKITAQLGWKPAYSFQDGMARTIQWYLEHRDWMARIVSGSYQSYYEEMYGHG